MAIESTKPECCWHVIKVAPYLEMEIRQIPTLPVTSESMGQLELILIGQYILGKTR